MATRKGPPHSFGWLKIKQRTSVEGVLIEEWEEPSGERHFLYPGEWIERYPNGAFIVIVPPEHMKNKFRHA